MANNITQWGGDGSGNGQFNGPNGVAVDSSGNVYVADYHNNRIQKFNSTGGYLTQWGSYGGGNEQFCQPYGVAVDSSGNVFVADEFNHCIKKFNSTDGKTYNFVTYVGNETIKRGRGKGQFNHPISVAVDSFGNVYVADSENNRIQKFAPNVSKPTTLSKTKTNFPDFLFIVVLVSAMLILIVLLRRKKR